MVRGRFGDVAQEASVLYQHANDPGNVQVQAILKSLFGPAAPVRFGPSGGRGGSRPPRWSA